VPADNPIVAFLARQHAMIKQSEADAYSKLLSDENLALEVLWLQDHQEKSMAKFDAFSYSGHKFADAARLADELIKNPYFLKLQKDNARAKREALKIHRKLEALEPNWGYKFWAESIISGQGDLGTIGDIERMMSFSKSFDDGRMSELGLSERIPEYKKILSKHRDMEYILRWSPPRFKVWVELYNLCKDRR
jgi:hypothetical protein